MMSLKKRISEDLKNAMRAREPIRLATVRAIRAAIINAEKEGREEDLSDEEILQLVQREAKRRREAIPQFQAGKRQDLVEQAEKELAVLEEYLPRQLTPEEIEGTVRGILDGLGLNHPSQMGRAMSEVMPAFKGRADGRLVNQIVRAILAGGGGG